MEGPLEEARRTALFEHVEGLRRAHGDVVDFGRLERGFEFRGRRHPLMHRQKGIYVPKDSTVALTIRTSRRGPYEDRFESDDTLLYAMERGGLGVRENDACVEAFRRDLPLLYIHQVAIGPPARYALIQPVWIVDVGAAEFSVEMQPRLRARLRGADVTGEGVLPDFSARIERAYQPVLIRRRIHQDRFRELVLRAYDVQCAMCGLRRERLLDAAHIDPDRDPRGEPVVTNGLSLCGIHHRAFDLHYMSIEPDTYRIRVGPGILAEEDGPMLRHGVQALDGERLHLPRAKAAHPDPERLARHFATFQAAG